MKPSWCALPIALLVSSLPGLARGQEASHANRSQVEILSDTRGVDLSPYMRTAISNLKSHWLASAQKVGHNSAGGAEQAIISFTIEPTGRTTSMVLEHPSGDVKLDRAAWTAITTTDFSPLPPTLDSPLKLRVTFQGD
jgi:TonB family protein